MDMSLIGDDDSRPKTGYLYANTLSYADFILPNDPRLTDPNPYELPNMSRRGIRLTRAEMLRQGLPYATSTPAPSTSRSSLNNHSAADQLLYDNDDDGLQSTPVMSNRLNGILPTSPASSSGGSPMYTRSQCASGRLCAVPDCPLHTNRKKRRPKHMDDASVNTDNTSVANHEEFTDEDVGHDMSISNGRRAVELQGLDQTASSQVRRSRRVAEYAQQNHYDYTGYNDDDVEEVTVVRRIYRKFTNSVHSTSTVLDAYTPDVVRNLQENVSRVIPFWILSILTLSLLLLILWGTDSLPSTDTIQSSSQLLWTNMTYAFTWFFTCITSLVLYPKVMISSAIGYMTPKTSESVLLESIQSESCSKRVEDALSTYKMELNLLKKRLDDIQTSQSNIPVDQMTSDLNHIRKTCCKKEEEFKKVFGELSRSFWMSLFPSIGDSSDDDTFRRNVRASFEKLSSDLNSKQLDEFYQKFQDKLDETVVKIMVNIEGIKKDQEKMLSSHDAHQSSSHNMTEDKIRDMITQALFVYDADKTGMPDYALEPAGGTVINTRCSETYNPHTTTYKILGVPIWRTSVSPRAVIQPNMAPGECWAFKGSEGRMVIKLSQQIIPKSFTYEHIPKQISRDGNIQSAPRKFQVLGLKDDKDVEGHVLGVYEYLDNGYPLQNFEVQDKSGKPYQFIELNVLSNHGNLEYTCLYRFRVHGKKVLY